MKDSITTPNISLEQCIEWLDENISDYPDTPSIDKITLKTIRGLLTKQSEDIKLLEKTCNYQKLIEDYGKRWDRDHPNILPLELLPKGVSFCALIKYRNNGLEFYVVRLLKKNRVYENGGDKTPHAAFMAALEKCK